uniref:Uncharacterized protein n=1 Tax=Lactuca sativa TaxID=4236 RepID=A0A9R1X345_LACSA|nr:hypothetical protein LSAT_V11C700369150 [Lactuca sativa]
MNNFLDVISSSSSSDEDSDDDELVMHTLLSVAHDIVRQRGETSNVEKKRRKPINRGLRGGERTFGTLYDISKFEDRFRISRNLFLRIVRDLENNYEFFQLRWDARGKRGFTTFQKCTAALRQLTYGIAVDASDEYLKMSARTGRECTYLFCEYVIELYGDIYLRNPTRNDVEQLYAAHQAKHGFPGMLGSIEREKLMKVMKACVILHNMILEEEGKAICTYTPNDMLNPPAVIQVDSPTYFTRLLEIQNSETHHNLRQDLTEHIWQQQFEDENEVDEDGGDEDNDANE